MKLRLHDKIALAALRLRACAGVLHRRLKPTYSLHYLELYSDAQAKADLSAGLEAGSIDTRFMYNDAWGGQAQEQDYPYRRQGKEAAAHLLASAPWPKAAARTFILLGAGTGEMEAPFVKRGLERWNHSQVTFVDISRFQLRSAIGELATMTSPQQTIEAIAIRADFAQLASVLTLPDVSTHLTRSGGPATYLLLGQTFANVREGQFVDSLFSVMRPGDLFVFDLELIRLEDGTEQELEPIRAHYASPNILKVVVRPLNRPANDDFQDLSVVVENAGTHSTIPGTLSIVTTCERDGRRAEIACSNRYDEAELLRFMAIKGFGLLAASASPENRFFKCLAFRKN